MENLSTDNLMRLQVEQLEKEKRELNEKMRIVSKRVDHIERAYRKDERPLLAKDYDVQQTNDKAAHEAAQKSRLETARLTHEQDVETKKRLLRMMDDYKAYREVTVGKRGEEFANRQQLAQKKIEEEKAKRRAAVQKEREEERFRLEEEERLRIEQEEEERRQEEGKCTQACVLRAALTDCDLCQLSARRKSVVLQRRKPLRQRRRPANARPRRKRPHCAKNARPSAKKRSKRLACSNSAKKRPSSVVCSVRQNANASARRRAHPLPVRRRRLPRRVPGVVQALRHRHHRAHPLRSPRKVRAPRRSTVLVDSLLPVEGADGVRARLRGGRPRLLGLRRHRAPSRPRRRRRSLKRRRTASRLSRPRSGALNVVGPERVLAFMYSCSVPMQ